MSKDNKLNERTIEFFEGDELRARTWAEKYALRDKDNNIIESHPSQMWIRLSDSIASVENEDIRDYWSDLFYDTLKDFKFIPGGRIMFGAGVDRKATLLNCYVIPVQEDSIEGIFKWCSEAGKTYSYGGGVGTDISILRPKDSPVNNAAMTSTGAVSFMDLFSKVTGTIGQNARRGALMISIDVNHPDILDFIDVKNDEGRQNVRFANISVKVTDDFMRKVSADSTIDLVHNGKVYNTVRARDIWDKIIDSAYESAEPGLLFWDTIKKDSPTEYNNMNVHAVNPCSEQALDPYNNCCLGSINLSKFVHNENEAPDKVYLNVGKGFRTYGKNTISTLAIGNSSLEEEYSDLFGLINSDEYLNTKVLNQIDFTNLAHTIGVAVRFLDNVITYNADRHPLKEQTIASELSRRIGLGVTGLGDMLASLEIPYDSREALTVVDTVMHFIMSCAYLASSELAKEKGTFSLYDAEQHLSRSFIKKNMQKWLIKDFIEPNGLRNSCILTMPPVGSGSVVAGTSSGIEPIFALEYTRRSETLTKEKYTVKHTSYQKYYDELVDSFKSEDNIPKEMIKPSWFRVAHEIDPYFRVEMQSVIQRYVDSAISSTVNLHRDVSKETIKDIYFTAWESGCKGITVYREDSREGILITDTEKKEDDIVEIPDKLNDLKENIQNIADDFNRGYKLYGQTYKIKTGHGNLYVTINEDNETGYPIEVFVHIGKSGLSTTADAEALGRMVSLALRSNATLEDVIAQLADISGNRPIFSEGSSVKSVPDAVSKILYSYSKQLKIKPKMRSLEDDYKLNKTEIDSKVALKNAPEFCLQPTDCHATIINGCLMCHYCGESKCD